MFLPISTNFTSTLGIPLSSPILKKGSFKCTSWVKPRAFTSDLPNRRTRFTPSNSEQRLHPPYYRGCWHGVSRCFLQWYHHISNLFKTRLFSHLTELYNPKALFTHAALLRQGFPHCAKFLTAASRRSLDRVPVPVWLIILSDQLTIVALVGLYPTNKLMVREPVLKRQLSRRGHLSSQDPKIMGLYPVLATLSRSYSRFKGRLLTRYSPVRHFTPPSKLGVSRPTCMC